MNVLLTNILVEILCQQNQHLCPGSLLFPQILTKYDFVISVDTFKIFSIRYTITITTSTAQNNLELHLLHVKSLLSNLCHFYNVMNVENISTHGFQYLLQ